MLSVPGKRGDRHHIMAGCGTHGTRVLLHAATQQRHVTSHVMRVLRVTNVTTYVIAADQVICVEYASDVTTAGLDCSSICFIPGPQPALDVATHALERSSGNHALSYNNNDKQK